MKKGLLLIFCTFLLASCQNQKDKIATKTKVMKQQIDWQGHRGARGLLPENTIPSFLLALSFPKVSTLEMDVVISKDSQVIISHEPYFSHHISSTPEGQPVTEAESKNLNIYEMTATEISTFDVGKRGNSRFPEQVPMAINKPTFKKMIQAVREFCKKNNRELPGFNIELKSDPKDYNKYFPQPERFVTLLLQEIDFLNIREKVNLQSFDVNILEEIHKQAPTISTALLVEKVNTFAAHLQTISFKPTNYSPYFEFVTADVIREAQSLGIRVIPWTVNELKDMQRMVDLGVDGIITDYPNRIQKLNLAK